MEIYYINVFNEVTQYYDPNDSDENTPSFGQQLKRAGNYFTNWEEAQKVVSERRKILKK